MRVLTTGTFDIPHAGHLNFLRQCSELGESLVIGVLSDSFVEAYKGDRPLFDEETRAILIGEATGAPTHIVDDQRKFFQQYGDIDGTTIAVGSDWARRDYYDQIGVTQEELDYWGYTLAYVPYTPGISSSEIKRRIREER